MTFTKDTSLLFKKAVKLSKYLKKEYIVHHKDKNRLNNNIENLEVMKKSEHSSRHSAEKLNEIKRDSLGRFLPRKK